MKHELYVEKGQGPPIVFNHGTFMDLTMFEPQLEHLSDKYRVISYNSRVLAGPNVPHTLDDLADDCLCLLDKLGVEKCVLAGMSVGGFMAMHFALHYQNRLNGLILIDAFASAFTQEEKEAFGPKFGELNTEGMIPRDFAEWVAPFCFGETTFRQNRPLVDFWIDRWSSIIPARSVYHQALSWLDKPDLTEALADIKVPTLLMCGEEDVRMPEEHLQEMYEKLPDAELVLVPKAGHSSNIENPMAANKIIQSYMKRIHNF